MQGSAFQRNNQRVFQEVKIVSVLLKGNLKQKPQSGTWSTFYSIKLNEGVTTDLVQGRSTYMYKNKKLGD